jgi:hypothetical protein
MTKKLLINLIIYLKISFSDMTIGSIATWLSISNMYKVPYRMNWKHGCNVGVSPKKKFKKSTIQAPLGLSSDIGDKKFVNSCFVMKCKLRVCSVTLNRKKEDGNSKIVINAIIGQHHH